MKRRLAVVAGIGTVVVASGAAAFANSAAFSGRADGGPPAAPIEGLATAPEVEVAIDDPHGVSTTSGHGDDQLGYRAYDAGGAGIVVLRVRGNALELVTTRPTTGWSQVDEDHETRDGVAMVEVTFTDGTSDVEFEALLVNGEIVTRVETSAAGHNEDRDHDGDHDEDDGVTGGEHDDATGPGSTATSVDVDDDGLEIDEDGPEIDEDGLEIDEDGPEIDDDGLEIDDDGPEVDERETPEAPEAPESDS